MRPSNPAPKVNPMILTTLTEDRHPSLMEIARLSKYTKDAGNPSFTSPAAYRDGLVLGAVDGGLLVGFCVVRLPLERDEVNVYFIAVRPDYKRCGVARALLAYALLRGDGSPVRLNVLLENVEGVATYRSLGFETVGACYKDTGMRMELNELPTPGGWVLEPGDGFPRLPTIRQCFRELLGHAQTPSRVELMIHTPAVRSEVHRRWPELEFWEQPESQSAQSRETAADLRRVDDALSQSQKGAGIVLDFNSFTFLDLVRDTPRAGLVRKAARSMPSWVIIADSAAKYLHLNFRSYGLGSASHAEYVEKLCGQLSVGVGLYSVKVRQHYAATFLLLVP